MPNSPTSLRSSAPFRLDWRPSRLLAGGLVALGVFAGVALLCCEMPRPWAVPASLLACGEGVRLARRELCRPRQQLTITVSGTATLDGEALDEWCLQWRFGLPVFGGRGPDGRWRHRVAWPDSLGAAGRRELRLAVPVQPRAQLLPSMAS